MKRRLSSHLISISVIRFVLPLIALSAVAFFVLITWQAIIFIERRRTSEIFAANSPLQTFAGPLVSLLALFFVILAYFVQERSERRSQNHRMIEMIMRFDDDYFREVRNQAWICRSMWYHLPEPERSEWRLNLIREAIPITVEGAVPKYQSEGKEDMERLKKRTEHWAVFRMINLYQSLAFFECDDQQLSSVSFFYPYWLGFLYDVINVYERLYEDGVKPTERHMLPREKWKETLAHLDRRLGLPPYYLEADPQMRLFQELLKMG